MTQMIREFQAAPARLQPGMRAILLPSRALAHVNLATAAAKIATPTLLPGLAGVLSAFGATLSPAKLRAQNFGDESTRSDQFWVAIELCHWQVELGGARWMADAQRLGLSIAESSAIGATLAELFSTSDALLVRHENGSLSLRCDVATPRVQAIFPDQALGAELKSLLPTPLVWQRYLNEAQMLLASHPVNQARAARGEAVVNSVWFWGAEVIATETPPIAFRYFGDDPILRALEQHLADLAVPAIQLEDWRMLTAAEICARLEQCADTDLLWLADGRTLRTKPNPSGIKQKLLRWLGVHS